MCQISLANGAEGRQGLYPQQGPKVYPSTSYLTHVLSLPTNYLFQGSHQMRGKLIYGSSSLLCFSLIHRCSSFNSLTHTHPFLFHRHSSFIHYSFTSSSHLVRGLPINITLLTSNSIVLSSFIISLCPNLIDTLISARPSNSLAIISP